MFAKVVWWVAIASGLLIFFNVVGNLPEFLRVPRDAMVPPGWLGMTAVVCATIGALCQVARVASGKDAEEMQRKWNKK